MSLVIPNPYPRQEKYKQNPLVDSLKKLEDVSYSFNNNFSENSSERLRHQRLVVLLVNSSSFEVTETTERAWRASFANDLSVSRTKPLPQQQDLDKSLASHPTGEEEVLDWDFYVENPPLKPTATIELEFEYGGRSKPIPVTDPWDE